jgi:hypothetical protein
MYPIDYKALVFWQANRYLYHKSNLMKAIQNLLETLKELISEAAQNQSGYNKLQLIPLPVKNQKKNYPNQNNNQ